MFSFPESTLLKVWRRSTRPGCETRGRKGFSSSGFSLSFLVAGDEVFRGGDEGFLRSLDDCLPGES
jgi:hypothetical protein